VPRPLALSLVLVLAPLAAAHQDPPAAPDPAALVKLLGSPSFEAREAAEQRLKALGPAALAAVRAGAASTDPEVAARCAVVRDHIWAADAQAFLAGKKDHSSATWKQFKTIAGDSADARTLFAEVMSDARRAEELEKAEADPAKAHEVYAAALGRAKEAVAKVFVPFMGRPIAGDLGKDAQDAVRQALPAAEVAAVLLLGTHPLPAGVADPADVPALFKAGFADGAEGPLKEPFRKLFAAWLDRRKEPRAIQAGLTAALYCGVPEAAAVARRVAADKAATPGLLAQALLVVGNHGGRNDLPLLAARRADDRATSRMLPPGPVPALAPGPAPAPGPGDTRVRDVAAGMALRLSGQDFVAYGFGAEQWYTWQVRPGVALFQGVGGRFPSDEAREAAHKKAWAWLDQQPKPAPGGPAAPNPNKR